MQVIETKREAREWVLNKRMAGHSVALVPTMGALHEGHYSLVAAGKAKCDSTIATIFVNPTQFGPGEDLSRYPRTLESDLDGLRTAGASAVFVPAAGSMYSPEHSTFVQPPEVAKRWEGELRPEHFRGVTTVVLKLMHILPATDAMFGQKDFQQAAVIRAMVSDLDIDMRIEVCPIVREPDGLAMSSRNRYLSEEERKRALGLSAALDRAERAVQGGERNVKAIESMMRDVLQQSRVDQIDYAVVADPRTLEQSQQLGRANVALVAARVGSTRLIDNTVWNL
jgi:pantoate--beta-alanine ligase